MWPRTLALAASFFVPMRRHMNQFRHIADLGNRTLSSSQLVNRGLPPSVIP